MAKIFGLQKVVGGNPTMSDLNTVLQKKDSGDNISVFDAETGEYYSVTMIGRATGVNDVLDKGHIILVIKQ